MIQFTDILKVHIRKSTKLIIWIVTLDLVFKMLKEHVRNSPSLLLLYLSKPFQVETDPRDSIGVILYQDGKSITFKSKKLDPNHCGYTFQEKKLFAFI